MKRPLAKVIPLRRPAADLAELGDEAMVAGCAIGDPVARAALFERHVDAVHRFVSRMWHGDPAAVDDLTQSTFVEAYRSAHRFRTGPEDGVGAAGGGRARPWLFGIAANLTRSHARREGRRIRAMSVIAGLHRDEPAVAVEPGDRDRIARLPAAIAALAHDLRAALVLIDLEQQSGRDAAAALRIPEGTLWRRVFHARRKVRSFIDEGRR